MAAAAAASAAAAAVELLVDTFASQQRQPVKIVPEMNRKDLLEHEGVSSEPGNGGEGFAII